MVQLIELLDKRNHFLQKFQLINEGELLNFERGDFKNLDAFYKCRDRILNILGHIDQMIDDRTHALTNFQNVLPRQRHQVVFHIDKKEALVKEILEQDLKLISLIETEKSHMIKELNGVKRHGKILRKYKSGRPSTTFDEKA